MARSVEEEVDPLTVNTLAFDDGQCFFSARWEGHGVDHVGRVGDPITGEVYRLRRDGKVISEEVRLRDHDGVVARSAFLA